MAESHSYMPKSANKIKKGRCCMKKFSQVMAGLLVAILVISVPATAVEAAWFRNLFRRGADEQQEAQEAVLERFGSDVPDNLNETGFRIVKEPITVTSFLYQPDVLAGCWTEIELMAWMEELTGVHWEYDILNDGDQYREQLNLRFLSGSYPDVINARGEISRDMYWLDEEAYGREGFLIDHRPLVARWMPNLQNFYTVYPAARVTQTSSDGRMYGFPFYYENGVGGNPHTWYMETYFATLLGYNYDNMPETVEELNKMMYDLKDILDRGDYMDPDPEMVVLGMRSTFGNNTMTNVLLAAFTGTLISVASPWAAPDNKTVEFMIEHPGYRAAAEMYHAWYRDGILNQDMFSMEPAAATNAKNSMKYVMFQGSSSPIQADLIRDARMPGAQERGYWGCTSIRPMTSEFNDRAMVAPEFRFWASHMSITDKAKHPEAIARWADIFFQMDYDYTDNSVPNPLMFFKGFYDVHWTHIDKPDNNIWTFMNQKGSDEQITWLYSTTNLVPGWNLPVGVYLTNNINHGTPLFNAKQHTNVHLQFPYVTTDTQIPGGARWTDAETTAASTRMADLRTYLEESWASFVSGGTPINDTTWDAFVAECYRLGAGEITEINQAVLDRWNAALED
jgi:putative aldouronate transport system substrate-binding protein